MTSNENFCRKKVKITGEIIFVPNFAKQSTFPSSTTVSGPYKIILRFALMLFRNVIHKNEDNESSLTLISRNRVGLCHS